MRLPRSTNWQRPTRDLSALLLLLLLIAPYRPALRFASDTVAATLDVHSR